MKSNISEIRFLKFINNKISHIKLLLRFALVSRRLYNRRISLTKLMAISKNDKINEGDNRKKSILIIDDKIPHPSLGAGFPRISKILSVLDELGYAITFYPSIGCYVEFPSAYDALPIKSEIINNGYSHPNMMKVFLQSRSNYYDFIFISRPHNMEHFQWIYMNHRKWFVNSKIIYDAEAVFTMREVLKLKLKGVSLPDNLINKLLSDEVFLATGTDAVITVSEAEKNLFIQKGVNKDRLFIVGHSISVSPTKRDFLQRKDFLFVGAILDDEDSPNADSLLWFVQKIFPIIKRKLGNNISVYIAGMNDSKKVASLSTNAGINLLGRVKDLTELYSKSRVFIAPTRFAAGIPHKVHEAAAMGVPTITTSLLEKQLNWKDGVEILVADTTEMFAEQCIKLYTNCDLWNKLRHNALDRVQKDCSEQRFKEQINSLLSYLNSGS